MQPATEFPAARGSGAVFSALGLVLVLSFLAAKGAALGLPTQGSSLQRKYLASRYLRVKDSAQGLFGKGC